MGKRKHSQLHPISKEKDGQTGGRSTQCPNVETATWGLLGDGVESDPRKGKENRMLKPQMATVEGRRGEAKHGGPLRDGSIIPLGGERATIRASSGGSRRSQQHGK